MFAVYNLMRLEKKYTIESCIHLLCISLCQQRTNLSHASLYFHIEKLYKVERKYAFYSCGKKGEIISLVSFRGCGNENSLNSSSFILFSNRMKRHVALIIEVKYSLTIMTMSYTL